MKKNTLIIMMLFFNFINTNAQENNKLALKICSFNIRFDNQADGKYAWGNRKNLVKNTLQKYSPDIIGVQEALKHQNDDIITLMPEYLYIGVAREDGYENGEYSPVFFKKDRFDCLQSGTFWLSETPEIPGSKSWNTACTRIVSWAKLFDKTNNEQFFIFNTHFDHMSGWAQQESAKLLLAKLDSIAGDTQVIVTGDFNATNDSAAIQILENAKDPRKLTDTKTISEQKHTGGDCTFGGFPFRSSKNYTIDFIFTKNITKKVKQHFNIQDNDNGFYPSDHLPVFTILE